MSKDKHLKPNYNEPGTNRDYYEAQEQAAASGVNSDYATDYPGSKPATYDMYNPNQYDYSYRNNYSDSFYHDGYEKEDSGSGFIAGALIGALIGAGAALLLAPKTGKELRTDVTNQAGTIKEKGIELTHVAKDKTSNITGSVKEKTGDITKKVQDQTSKVVDKVKSKKGQNAPMDDGTASSEGEEPIELIDTVAEKVESAIESGQEKANSTAEALKTAVEEKEKEAKDMAKKSEKDSKSNKGTKKVGSNKKPDTNANNTPNDPSTKDQHSGNTPYSYDNSENAGDNKVMAMNHISKIENDKKDNKNT
ncbi:Gas vesicle protein [Bhargavaea ginsengi]|uniref:Gas vesicle protein n=1 Tax=Bhargavaea ginsengi TaxID=426757 RepID=A0A1H6XZP9_9BACL|nr:YtxH domain-containing protein [Bhargavaea ginsengi]MCM3086361.1 YtxH domain-containing protein [Bhargavaea ginsengi]SEJ33114.1 Gas vesicle protein [Bhargavaea ginsengi]